MTAEIGQSEFLAVVGTEFDGHDVGVGCGLRAQKRPNIGGLGLAVSVVVVTPTPLSLTWERVGDLR